MNRANADQSPPERSPEGPSGKALLIDIRRVSKEYQSGDNVVRALRDVDLQIYEGEFVAIVGTSGSGKSTLMNMLGCLDRPTYGTYTISGIDAGDRSNDARALVRNRLIGFIFQGFNLLPRTTALENVELPLQYRGIAAAERRRRATASLDAVGLAARMHHTPNQLSGGQQQRVAIARALVTDPPLLLADEPTGNLDTRTSYEVLALLQKLNRERGITIVLVTHERDIAACASRIITMRDGRIVTDVHQEERIDAAAELAALPPPEEYKPLAGEREDDAATILRKKLGGPVPPVAYVGAVLGLMLGAIVGLVYNRLVLGSQVALTILVAALLGEVWLAATLARRRLGKPLTADQRSRLAIHFTAGVFAAAAVVGAITLRVVSRWPEAASNVLSGIAGRGLAVAGAVTVLVFAAFALLQYLLISLVNPRR